MGDKRRTRQERIRDRLTRPATVRPPSRVDPGSGTAIDFVILRVALEAALWVQRVRYSGDTPTESQTETTGRFMLAYPPPGVFYADMAPFEYPLIHATTLLPWTANPVDDDESTWSQANFTDSLDTETLASKFYPLLMLRHGSVFVLVPPLWITANVGFYDELQAMSEGSSV